MPSSTFVRDYKDLIVWQRAMDLAATCHAIVSSMPRGTRGHLGSQILRAADSVPANLAEGHSRPSTGDFLQFIGIARASLKELESHLLLLERLGHARGPQLDRALSLIEQCSRMLTVLRRRLSE